MKGHNAGAIALLLTVAVTTLTYRMPLPVAISAAVLGMLNGLIQIGTIILAAVFLYNLTVESGQDELIKSSISSLSTDRRLQALLIAFCFSAFMEGSTGLGAPVAVCAAMLIGIGFPAVPAALICLAPSGACLYQAAFSMGTPDAVIIAAVEAALSQAPPQAAGTGPHKPRAGGARKKGRGDRR